MLHIDFVAVYEQLKFWLPVTTFLGLLYKAYKQAKVGVSQWANVLLDNHMSHIQTATEKASDAVIQLADYHKDMLASQKLLVNTLGEVKEDFHEFVRDVNQTQTNIATGIEVIKSKLDTSLIAQVKLTSEKNKGN